MLTALLRQWQRRRLRDPAYAGMYSEHPDELVSLDCETTSLNPAEAELLSIGAVKLRGNRILASEALYLLVRPERAPPADNVRIHGLRPIDVNQGMEARDAMRRLLDFVGGRPLLGYYLEYDMAVLNRYIRPWLGVPLPQRRIEISGRYYDYKLRQNPDAHIDLRLASICQDLDMPAPPRHDALNDAINAAMLYLALKQRGYG
ncbi:DNA polymerase-3 subunit epsilon [Chromobacterium alkanivorans]|uniref:3'-5' exonuclease n=1 Tax=Chromobacterium alkanivorans TaxID=1071719 RepID=UPI00216948C5|nr:3'-5' exonuclease [Chromobacterium alkanivorans]MCS3805963.1 DNA polymerase-3 subunit epsilon [Chromobacterium alkanivorans]MCS3820301.1 DNA polymerase-3 subunit epsilon [Chromobacterium alkanivorans]MCS3875059.1 DNA polymerase-3 subunit epsilon [Chromobacterium alkanivorans]